jgi:ankyrin repeat protein
MHHAVSRSGAQGRRAASRHAAVLTACLAAGLADVQAQEAQAAVAAAEGRDAARAQEGVVNRPEFGPPLLAAVQAGEALQVRDWLKRGAPVDVRDPQGNTPLLLAVRGNHIEIARSLLVHGANPNLKNDMQDSAYLLAGALGRLEILRMVLSYGADLQSTNRYGGTALIPACERGHVETVQALLAAGVKADHVNRLGWTCLLETVLLGDGGPRYQDIVRQLIAAKADLSLPDKDGVTALAHARQRSQHEVERLLREAGAR